MSVREYALHVPLEGQLDVEAHVQEFDGRFRNSGFLYGHAMKVLGLGAYENMQRSLREPQPDGRYHAFSTYPYADWIRVASAAAAAMFPDVSGREAFRRYARDDASRFGATTLGKITLSLVPDPAAAMLQIPSMTRRLSSGWEVQAERTTDGVCFEFAWLPSETAALVGQFEGSAQMFDVEPHTRVERIGDGGRILLAW